MSKLCCFFIKTLVNNTTVVRTFNYDIVFSLNNFYYKQQQKYTVRSNKNQPQNTVAKNIK